jgi:hypothetical protein
MFGTFPVRLYVKAAVLPQHGFIKSKKSVGVESDAEFAVMEVSPRRFGGFGLTVHPTKTKLVPFRPPPSNLKDDNQPDDRPGTFDPLGFTHYWAGSLTGNWVVKV